MMQFRNYWKISLVTATSSYFGVTNNSALDLVRTYNFESILDLYIKNKGKDFD